MGRVTRRLGYRMERLVVVFSLFLVSAAEKQDLSGKMFTFAAPSNRHHVSLTPSLDNNPNITSATVCLRAFSDLSRGHTIFSLELPSTHNAFVIFKSSHGVYKLHIGGQEVEYSGLQDEFNVWNTVCATWDGKTGVAQLWVNGNPSSRKGFGRGGFLSGTPKIVLGQKQEAYSGGFVGGQCLVGMLTDVHMWDSVLPLDQIENYTFREKFNPGNVLSWSSLEFTKAGYVLIENVKNAEKLRAAKTQG